MGRDFVNLIDSPIRVDSSSDVTMALCATNGFLVTVDPAECICLQTETVHLQVLITRIKPVMIINKLFRLFLERRYDHYLHITEAANVLMSTY